VSLIIESDNLWRGSGKIITLKTFPIKDPHGDYEVTDINLACYRLIKGFQKETIVPLEAWGLMSQEAKRFRVGDVVFAQGKFENKLWKDRDGFSHQKNVIVIESIKKETNEEENSFPK
jgi:hypothetical protein